MSANPAVLYKPYFPANISVFPKHANTSYLPIVKDQFYNLYQKGFLNQLLIDRTLRKNIIWATDTFAQLGEKYIKYSSLSSDAIIGKHDILTKLRKDGTLESTRKHGEVLTPLKICKTMCDHAHKTLRSKNWQKYVKATVLEITCGEAPFLISRHNRESGAIIPIKERIGLLDRKLQVVNEKTGSYEEWLEWVFIAFQSTYGYEFQGYNLLLGRINFLKTFEEYMIGRWARKPSNEEYARILEIISWNLWQMDGLTGTIPYGVLKKPSQGNLFNSPCGVNETPPCLIKDWQAGKVIPWQSLSGAK